jgi:hypothetical protein
MTLLMSDFKRSQLRVFLFGCPTQTTISEPDDAYDNEDDADDRSRFHDFDLTGGDGLGSN